MPELLPNFHAVPRAPLPVPTDQGANRAPATEAARTRLLVVDDEQQNLLTFRRVWRRHFDIDTADSGEVGLRLLAEREYDVVLTDFGMPRMDGATFIELGRRLRPVSFILVTGYVDKPEVRALEERGAIFATLAKPWRLDAMQDVIVRASAHSLALRGGPR